MNLITLLKLQWFIMESLFKGHGLPKTIVIGAVIDFSTRAIEVESPALFINNTVIEGDITLKVSNQSDK